MTQSDDYLGKLVFIIDDALDTGENIFSLIDYCARKRAEFIFVYVLVSRGSRKIIRRLENLKVYSESKLYFKYLASIPIPTYEKESCPICNIVQQLEESLALLDDNNGQKILYDFIKDEINKYSEVSIEMLNKVRSTYFNHTNHNDIFLRCKLELALTSDKDRADLVEFVYANSKADTILTLLNLMYYEDLFEIFLADYESPETETMLSKIIIENCLYFLENSDKINYNDLNTLLTTLRFFSEENLINKYYKYGRDLINNKENFLILNYNLLISESAYVYSQSIISDLEQLYTLDCNEEIKILIQGLISFWNKILAVNTNKVNEKIVYLNELSKIFHEVSKYINYLQTYEDSDEIDPELKNEWNSLVDILKRISRYLRELTTVNFEDKSKIKILNILINKINFFITSGNQMIYNSQGAFLINEFKKIVDNIHNTINADEQSVVNVLSYFKVEIKGLAKRVIYTMNHPRFKEKGINIYDEIPEDKCLVFGDTTGLNLIISNIVDNVIKHSGARNFYYNLNINKARQVVELSILDDGILDPNFKNGKGINKIKEVSANYFGDYELLSVTDKKINNIKYNTLSKVTLLLIPN